MNGRTRTGESDEIVCTWEQIRLYLSSRIPIYIIILNDVYWSVSPCMLKTAKKSGPVVCGNNALRYTIEGVPRQDRKLRLSAFAINWLLPYFPILMIFDPHSLSGPAALKENHRNGRGSCSPVRWKRGIWRCARRSGCSISLVYPTDTNCGILADASTTCKGSTPAHVTACCDATPLSRR